MFDLAVIARSLAGLACRFDVDVLAGCDSTNAVLLARAGAGAPSGTVILAECQTAGRGRRGRAWFAAPGDSLTFSLLWRFAPRTDLSGLSLAIGLAVSLAIEKVGAGRTALKWPNDLLKEGRKLGGILIELVSGPRTPPDLTAVIGIGLNLRLPATMPDDLRAASAALGDGVEPNALLASILIELQGVLEQFARTGFADLRDAWTACHAFENQPICLLADFVPARTGWCRGVDGDGALLFEADGRIERILSGEVSLRAAP